MTKFRPIDEVFTLTSLMVFESMTKNKNISINNSVNMIKRSYPYMNFTDKYLKYIINNPKGQYKLLPLTRYITPFKYIINTDNEENNITNLIRPDYNIYDKEIKALNILYYFTYLALFYNISFDIEELINNIRHYFQIELETSAFNTVCKFPIKPVPFYLIFDDFKFIYKNIKLKKDNEISEYVKKVHRSRSKYPFMEEYK